MDLYCVSFSKVIWFIYIHSMTQNIYILFQILFHYRLSQDIEYSSLSYTVCMCVLSCFSYVRLFRTLWTAAHQAPLSMGFSRQNYWRGLPCPPPGNLPSPGIKLSSFTSPPLAGGFFTTSTTWEAIQ